MISELSQKEFHKIDHLLLGDRLNLEIEAVVAGFNPGWIFVDDVENPQTALVWSKGIEGFYLLGRPDSPTFNAEINSFVDENIAPRAKGLGLNDFEFSATSTVWDQAILKIFEKRDMIISTQLVFGKTANSTSTDFTPDDPNYRLHHVDPALLTDSSLDHQLIESAILEWWDSIESFMENGIGVAIYDKDQAVCTCVTSFMTQTTMESHIQTAPPHRKKGLATYAVQAFVKTALDQGFNLYWDCMESNLGSRALASKMNYQLQFTYPLYEFAFPTGEIDE